MKIKSSLRLLSVVLAALMILSVFTIIPVFADDGGTDGSITWKFNEAQESLTLSGSGAVNYKMDNAPWKDYGESIKTIYIDNGITSVEDIYADPYALEEVYLADSVVSIGNSAFYGFENLGSVHFGSGLKTIGSDAFGNTDISYVIFPDSLFYIGSYAFDDCDNLHSVTFGSGIETIGARAFAGTGFRRVELPNSITTIGNQAFGYYWDEWYDKEGVVQSGYIKRSAFEIVCEYNNEVFRYTVDNGFTYVDEDPSIYPKSVSLKAGKTKTIEVNDAAVTLWSSSNSKVAKVSQKGKVTALQKGTAKITADLLSGAKLTCTVKVTTSPKLSKSSISVKKGKTYKVKLSGKASSIKNKYTNTKKAKITSKTTATTLTVKGLKKGTTTLKVKVNGVKTLKLKVKVK